MSEGLKPVGRVVGGGGDLQALGALLKYVQSRYFVVDLHKLWCIGASATLVVWCFCVGLWMMGCAKW